MLIEAFLWLSATIFFIALASALVWGFFKLPKIVKVVTVISLIAATLGALIGGFVSVLRYGQENVYFLVVFGGFFGLVGAIFAYTYVKQGSR